MHSLQYNLNQNTSNEVSKKRKTKKLQDLLKYANMTKEEIRNLKKEKRQRKLWNKYKEKLEKERKEVAAQFRNNYAWDCFAISSNHETKKVNSQLQ